MRYDVARDMEWSRDAFKNIVWPVVKRVIGGDLIPVEGNPAGDSTQLDLVGGIDWLTNKGGQLFGISSRVQDAIKNLYPTFTIRQERPSGAATEVQKRRAEAHIPDSIKSHWWCHAYIDKQYSQFIMAGIALREHVIAALDTGLSYRQRNPSDNVKFEVLPWDKMNAAGFPVTEIYDDEAATLSWVRRFEKQYPACTVCGRPMVAGQTPTHLSCRGDL